MTARQRLLGRCVFLLTFTIPLATTLVEPVAAQGAPPPGGVLEVTGYRQLSLVAGSLGPVTVVVNGRKAAAIRSALAGLSTTSSLPDCMESRSAFKISILPRRGARPTYVATEDDCPTPGVVTISVDGKITQRLREDCSLRAVVITALPRGRAEGTRRDRSRCSL